MTAGFLSIFISRLVGFTTLAIFAFLWMLLLITKEDRQRRLNSILINLHEDECGRIDKKYEELCKPAKRQTENYCPPGKRRTRRA